MSISQRARMKINQAQYDEALFLLLTLNHPTWAEPLRYVNSATDKESNSVLYKAKSFAVPLPAQSKTELSTVTLVVQDAMRDCRLKLRQMTNRLPGTASLAVVFSEAPDVVEVGIMPFEFTEPSISNTACTFTLGLGSSLSETYPFHKIRPATHPGAFRNAV